ncbi:MAG: GNAT family N-acetyltransferase [Candidatus Aminicenantes bacterium]|nr:MAG: GNAT family N-acetyltransferase [Candidatus Aminicenantes bacterium]
MEIIDLEEKNKQSYFVCLEDWAEEMKEAENHKEIWFNEMKNRGLRVKLGIDEKGEVGGMIEYMPIEHAYAEGLDLYFVNCIWVHGYEKGRGDFQKKGMGKALLKAAEEDAKVLGAKGMAAWGISQPFWMNAPWYEKQGYTRVDSDNDIVLLWKPFSEDAIPPKWIKKKYGPELAPGKVTVTSFLNGQCPAGNIVHERTKRAVEEIGDKVILKTIETRDKEVMLQYGEKDALYIDNKKVNLGPPPSYEEIKGLIEEEVKKL